jgi:hypothetical protein
MIVARSLQDGADLSAPCTKATTSRTPVRPAPRLPLRSRRARKQQPARGSSNGDGREVSPTSSCLTGGRVPRSLIVNSERSSKDTSATLAVPPASRSITHTATEPARRVRTAGQPIRQARQPQPGGSGDPSRQTERTTALALRSSRNGELTRCADCDLDAVRFASGDAISSRRARNSRRLPQGSLAAQGRTGIHRKPWGSVWGLLPPCARGGDRG